MATLHEHMSETLIAVKDHLIDAGRLLQGLQESDADAIFPQVDRFLGATFSGVSRAARIATLLRPPVLQQYNVHQLFQSQAAELTAGIQSSFLAATHEKQSVRCTGDPEQVIACLQLFLQNIPLNAHSMIQIQLYAQGAVVRVEAHYDGLRAFPDILRWDGVELCSREEAEWCWLRATDGGALQLSSNPLVFSLTGEDDFAGLPDLDDATEDAATLNRILRRLRPWRATTGAWEPGYAAIDESAQLYLDSIANAIREINRVLGMESPRVH